MKKTKLITFLMALNITWPANASQYALQAANQASGPWEFAPTSPVVEAGQAAARI